MITLPRRPAKFSSSSFSIDRFQPLRGKTSPPTEEALLPPPADDCLAPGLDDPNTAMRCEPFPGSEYPFSLPACATVRDVLSAGPSGAPDWVGFQDLYDTARGTKRDDTSTPHYVQILGVRRSAVYRWKPGIWFAAASYSVSGRRRMSGVAPAPVSPCRSRSDYEYCSGGIS